MQFNNEHFDIIDAIYTVARTYTDQHSSPSKEADCNDQKPYTKTRRKARKRAVRSTYEFEGLLNNLFAGENSKARAEARLQNPLNIPVDNKFLGVFAIPTNQALSVRSDNQ